MELVVFIGALALLAVASALWGEDSRDYERGSGLIEVYTVEDEMRLARGLMERRASFLSAPKPRHPSPSPALPRLALANTAAALGALLVRVGTALQRRAVVGA
jgi:hypothetical protein